MNFEEKIEEIKVFYTYFLDILDNDEKSEENYDSLKKIICNHNFILNKSELEPFLNLISKVSQNHYRDSSFYDKIFRILSLFLDDMKKIYSNDTIFHIFRKDKRILLFLIEKEILTIDSEIMNILGRKKYKDRKYSEYFDIKKDHTDNNEEFIQKQHNGENDNYICKLIREDSIEDFISYINKNTISIKDYIIYPTEFETHKFLCKNQTNLIQYAAFFGSIQIFKYLLQNGVELNPIIWEFAVHSNNAELICTLEKECNERNISTIIKESIKCHHNEIASYFLQLINEQSTNYFNAVKYCNYQFYPTEKFNEYFILAIQKDYLFLVEHILSLSSTKINQIIKRKCNHKYGYYSESKHIDHIGRCHLEKIESFFLKQLFFYSPDDVHDRINVKDYFDKDFVYDESTTVLHIAVENNSIETVKLLLNRPEIDLILNQDCMKYKVNHSMEKMTSLHIAIENENYKIVKLLCQHHKIDVNIKVIRFAYSYMERFYLMEEIPPIHLAINHQNELIVHLLSNHQGIDINAKYVIKAWNVYGGRSQTVEFDEITPLSFAVETGNMNICLPILSNKDIDINCETIDCFSLKKNYIISFLIKRRLTPLHAAIFRNNADICQLLLSNKEIDVSHLYTKEYINVDFKKGKSSIDRTKQTKTPLYLATELKKENNELKIIFLLLSASKNNIFDEEGFAIYDADENLKPFDDNNNNNNDNDKKPNIIPYNFTTLRYMDIGYYIKDLFKKIEEDKNVVNDDFKYKKIQNATINVNILIDINDLNDLNDFDSKYNLIIKNIPNSKDIDITLSRKFIPIDSIEYSSSDLLLYEKEEEEFNEVLIEEEEEEFIDTDDK